MDPVIERSFYGQFSVALDFQVAFTVNCRSGFVCFFTSRPFVYDDILRVFFRGYFHFVGIENKNRRAVGTGNFHRFEIDFHHVGVACIDDDLTVGKTSRAGINAGCRYCADIVFQGITVRSVCRYRKCVVSNFIFFIIKNIGQFRFRAVFRIRVVFAVDAAIRLQFP